MSILEELKEIFQNPVFSLSSLLVFSTLSFVFWVPEQFLKVLSWIQNIFVLNISWFYISLFFFFFCFCMYMAFGPYRKVCLGTGAPEYSNFTWISMLFSAGMGTGLLFSGVYEPLYHYFYPPMGTGATSEAVRTAFQITFLHWGFSGWSVYTLVGLALAYFSFCKNRPQRISSLFFADNNSQKRKILGAGIDILSVIVILFGVATTLGRGSMQINSGLKELFGVAYSSSLQAGIIACVTLAATFSLLSGLNKGIRRLSELNVLLCLLLLVFTLFVGPTSFLLNSFVEYSGAYLQNLIASMTWVNSLHSVEWRSQWTILYWAWWMAWAPFVGLFIARISRGRTIQELVLGCLILPTLLSCLWFVIFGGTAIQYHILGKMQLEPLLKTEYSIILFEFLKYLPLTKVVSILSLFAVVVFFITSSDSASYVVHRISSSSNKEKGQKEKRGFLKIYWALLEGLLAITLVVFGGIKSLELLVIIAAFPFSILIFCICLVFIKNLKKDFS